MKVELCHPDIFPQWPKMSLLSSLLTTRWGKALNNPVLSSLLTPLWAGGWTRDLLRSHPTSASCDPLSFFSCTAAVIWLQDKTEIPFTYSAVPHWSRQSCTRRSPRNVWGFHSSFPPVLAGSVPAFTIFPGSWAHFGLANFLLVLAGCQKHSRSGKESLLVSPILQWF